MANIHTINEKQKTIKRKGTRTIPSIKRPMNVEELKWMFALRACRFIFICGPPKYAHHTEQRNQS